jgi:uncharacterized membrane protein
MTDLVISNFSDEHTALELRAEIAKLLKEYLIVRLFSRFYWVPGVF